MLIPMSKQRQLGFSMVELAVVILIMGLLLGGLVMPLATQRDNARLREGQEQLESILIDLRVSEPSDDSARRK